MKVLVSGRTGYVGSNVANYLQKNNEIATLSRQYEIKNCIDRYDVFCYFSNPNEILFNTDSKLANIEATEHFYRIVEVLEKLNIMHLIYASTVRIFDKQLNNYANTHLYIETLLEAYCTKKNIILTKARFSNVFGGLLESMQKRNTLVPHIFIDNAIYKNYIAVLTDGEQKRDFVSINLVHRYIDYILNNKPNEINICSGSNFKIIEIARIVQKVFPTVVLKVGDKHLHEEEIEYKAIIKFERSEVENEIINIANAWKNNYA